MEYVIENGVHELSGIGSMQYYDEFMRQEYDVDLFIIDGVLYGAYKDIDDGFRSYGRFERVTEKPEEGIFLSTFEPQKVMVVNDQVKRYDEDWGWCIEDTLTLTMTDVKNGKVVLLVGTDYSDTYYPCAIFDYNPLNLQVNIDKGC